MTVNWVDDMYNMHKKFGVHEWVKKNKDNKELMRKFLEFRIRFLQEELDETRKAVDASDAEEIVDGLIDLCVVAIGTLDAFDVNARVAWNEIFEANMSKEPGIKESRPNPLGLPDLIKKPDWKGPDHTGNHGLFANNI
mgnify:FL=1|tara:strand:+ start:2041 stop:2454 length:414 start_codon:yes stop_codon:yes gene_type:complete